MSDRPKTALELALEKLDAQGMAVKPLSEEKKAEIADIRAKYTSRIAKEEIGAQSRMASATSYEEIEQIRSRLSSERERLNGAMEKAVAEVRDR